MISPKSNGLLTEQHTLQDFSPPAQRLLDKHFVQARLGHIILNQRGYDPAVPFQANQEECLQIVPKLGISEVVE